MYFITVTNDIAKITDLTQKIGTTSSIVLAELMFKKVIAMYKSDGNFVTLCRKTYLATNEVVEFG